MDAQTLEIVKKAGRALARIAASKKQPVLLYALERVRSSSDLLEVLKEVSIGSSVWKPRRCVTSLWTPWSN